MGIICVFIIPNPLTQYLFSRFSELDQNNIQSISAYLRFIKPYIAAKEIIKTKNPLLGLGIGNAYGYVLSGVGNIGNSMQPALPRAFAELGIIGGVLFVLFIFKTYYKKNMHIGIYKVMIIGIYLMTFMHGTWTSEIYWLLLGLLNLSFVDVKDKGENLI